MPHDKIKAAARKRMAETGEPYTLARRMVIEEHARLKAQAPEAAISLPDGVGDLLRAMLGPDPSHSGPPYTHTLKLPETEEEMAAEPSEPSFTISRESE